MSELLALSARYIDEGIYEGPGSVNPMTTELNEVADGIALIEGFSHVIAMRTGEGLVVFDTSLEAFAPAMLKSLRAWSEDPVHTIAYTHGHVDHVGGAHDFFVDAHERSQPSPHVVSHQGVLGRFERYQLTNGYNAAINARQFGGVRGLGGMETGGTGRFGPGAWVPPNTTFRDQLQLIIGGLWLELRHTRGETDDHLWAWLPELDVICTGDLVTWVFPNAGNPQKAQRYPLEWSRALREMIELEPELLLPAHGLPIAGRARIRRVLEDLATALELLVRQTLELMNAGERLDTIVHAVSLPGELMERPYLRPVYDEPEFVVRNIWRLYGGWYDGNPARLKPAPEAALARELAALAGGAQALVQRARECAEQGDLRMACELVELATQAEPGSREAHGARAELYTARRKSELSLMAKGIYGDAARRSQAIADRET